MKTGRNGRRPVPVGRIAIAVVVLAAAAFAAIMFIREQRESTEKLADRAYAMDAFLDAGETYRLDSVVKNNQKILRILRPMSAPEEYRFLPGECALWADAIDRFVYMDGSKVKTCDINGENQETIFQVSGFRYVARVWEIIDDYAIVERTYRAFSGGFGAEGDYFLVNLLTGECVELRINPSRGIRYACIADGFFYYSTCDAGVSGVDAKNSDRYRDICRCNLETGEHEVLTDAIVPDDGEIFDDGQGLNDGGCVIDGYLYFTLDSDPAWLTRVPVTGGDVEKVEASRLDLEQSGTRGIAQIAGYDGKVLIACECWEDGVGYSVRVFAFDPSAGELSELLHWPVDESVKIVKLRVQDDTLLVCDWGGTVLQGKLA